MDGTNRIDDPAMVIVLRWESATVPPQHSSAYEVRIGPSTSASAVLWTNQHESETSETLVEYQVDAGTLARLRSIVAPLLEHDWAYPTEPMVGGELVSFTITIGGRTTEIPCGLPHYEAVTLAPLYRIVMDTVPTISRDRLPRWQLADATPTTAH